MRLRVLISGAALYIALTFTTSACRPHTDQAGAAPMFNDDRGVISVPAGSPLRSHLSVQPVDGTVVGGTLDLPAAVEADPARVTNVLAPLTGRVVALDVALGQRVKRGQILAVIASGDFAQAEADDRKAADALDLTRKALTRARAVQAAGGAAGKDIEAAQSAYAQAQAEQARAQSRLVTLNGGARGHAQNLTLKAPQSGVVTALATASGAQINDPAATLMTVTNLDRVFVTANVAEDDIAKVKPGENAAVILAADPDHPIRARITQANAFIEADTRRRKVRIALANGEGRLLPNMYATVRLAAPAAGGVFVPQSALLMNNDVVSVLVEVRPWVFRRQAVKIGDETETAAHVLAGLKSGDRVVVRGGVLLDD